ncbi:hypothetical protein ABBQ38_014843 [Trebouxia sp. C0009 RCD-2024]
MSESYHCPEEQVFLEQTRILTQGKHARLKQLEVADASSAFGQQLCLDYFTLHKQLNTHKLSGEARADLLEQLEDKLATRLHLEELARQRRLTGDAQHDFLEVPAAGQQLRLQHEAAGMPAPGRADSAAPLQRQQETALLIAEATKEKEAEVHALQEALAEQERYLKASCCSLLDQLFCRCIRSADAYLSSVGHQAGCTACFCSLSSCEDWRAQPGTSTPTSSAAGAAQPRELGSMAWEVVQMLATTAQRPHLLEVQHRLDHSSLFCCTTTRSKCHADGTLLLMEGVMNLVPCVITQQGVQKQVPTMQHSLVPATMTAPQLRQQLHAFGLPLGGRQAELVHRLQTALAAAALHGSSVEDDDSLATTLAPAAMVQEAGLEVTLDKSGSARAPPFAPNHSTSKRKGAMHYSSSSAEDGPASKRARDAQRRIKGKGKAVAEPRQHLPRLSRFADEARQYERDSSESPELERVMQLSRQEHNTGSDPFMLNLALLAETFPESGGSGAAAAGSATEPSPPPQEGSAHDGEPASPTTGCLTQPEGAAPMLENNLQPHSRTVQGEAERPEVGEQDHPPASAHISRQAAPRDVRAEPGNAVGLLSPEYNAINEVIIAHSRFHLLVPLCSLQLWRSASDPEASAAECWAALLQHICAAPQLHAFALQEVMRLHHLTVEKLASQYYKGFLEKVKLRGKPNSPVASRTRNRRGAKPASPTGRGSRGESHGAVPLPAFARRKRSRKQAVPRRGTSSSPAVAAPRLVAEEQAAASGAAEAPSQRRVRWAEGSGHDSEPASPITDCLTQPEGTAPMPENTLHSHSRTGQHEAEQVEVGAQQHSSEPLDYAQEDGIDLGRPPPAGLPAKSCPEQHHPAASAHTRMQAAPRNMLAEPGNAVGLLSPEQQDVAQRQQQEHSLQQREPFLQQSAEGDHRMLCIEMYLCCCAYRKSFLEIVAYAASCVPHGYETVAVIGTNESLASWRLPVVSVFLFLSGALAEVLALHHLPIDHVASWYYKADVGSLEEVPNSSAAQRRVTWAEGADLEKICVFEAGDGSRLPRRDRMTWEVVQPLASSADRPSLPAVRNHLEQALNINLAGEQQLMLRILTSIQKDLDMQKAYELAADKYTEPAELLVVQLRKQLKAFSLPATGRKAELVHMLQAVLKAAAVHGRALDTAPPAL